MPSSNDATAKVAWITGGSRGIGAETAVRLAELGFDVALTARDQTRLEAVAKEVETLGRRALPLTSDLTERASMAAFAEAALSWGGRCDVLCNIGIYRGPGWSQLLMEMPIEELDISLEADVVAPALLCQRAIPSMIANGGGVIVNFSSAVVYLSPRSTVKDKPGGWSLSYAASKAAIDQFAKVINVELGTAGVRAYSVDPGYVAYGPEFLERVQGDGMGSNTVCPAEAIAPAIAWLVRSPAASELLSKRVYLPQVTAEHQLLPGWNGPGSPYPSRW
jgi:NAD(P)-dependent dehydrogenase (short-subunit alcohol dehydrogenase family)